MASLRLFGKIPVINTQVSGLIISSLNYLSNLVEIPSKPELFSNAAFVDRKPLPHTNILQLSPPPRGWCEEYRYRIRHSNLGGLRLSTVPLSRPNSGTTQCVFTSAVQTFSLINSCAGVILFMSCQQTSKSWERLSKSWEWLSNSWKRATYFVGTSFESRGNELVKKQPANYVFTNLFPWLT